MPVPKDRCACGLLKKAKSSWCRACWAVSVKTPIESPWRCACGAPKNNSADCCRSCWKTANETARIAALRCACGGPKAAKSKQCRACWFAVLAATCAQQTARCCSRCHGTFPVEAFSKARTGRGRRGSWCRDCRRIVSRTRGRIVIKLRHRLRVKYGITVDDYMTLWNIQGGRCAVCLERLEFNGHDSHLDHCHSTGCVRGLLCGRCNAAVGFAKDSPKLLRDLADYVEKVHELQR